MTTSKEIIEHFKEVDIRKKDDEIYVRDTDKGIFGVSDLDVMEKFFEKINCSEEDIFVDLGSGDGRVNILASLFCRSIGIEFDKDLVDESIRHNQSLGTDAVFYCKDYESFDFSYTTILFSFADHFFNKRFIEKLKEEFKGTLYIYQGIFTPDDVPKGRTVWVGQTPIYSYEFR